MAQHVRRILWRFGDVQKESEIFLTTRVNYGVRPAGCIAIAAVHQTAERFAGGMRGSLVPKNRTYVDDATGVSWDVENVCHISQDMERVIGNRGFHFQEIFKSVDPLDETGELRKILGLRWDTEKD